MSILKIDRQVTRLMEMLLSHSPLYTLEKLLLLLLPSLFSCSSQLLNRFLSLRKVVLNGSNYIKPTFASNQRQQPKSSSSDSFCFNSTSNLCCCFCIFSMVSFIFTFSSLWNSPFLHSLWISDCYKPWWNKRCVTLSPLNNLWFLHINWNGNAAIEFILLRPEVIMSPCLIKLMYPPVELMSASTT